LPVLIRRSAIGLLVLTVLSISAPASAHGIGGRTDLPVPVSYFVIGAVVVLVASFILLGLLWPSPRLQRPPQERPLHIPGWSAFRSILGVLGVVALGLVIAAGIINGTEGRDNIAPVLTWVVFWLVVPFASVFLGDVLWTSLDPWPRLARGLGVGSTEREPVLDRLGLWPATVAFVAFTWLELVYSDSANPAALATAALIYTAYLIAAMAWSGVVTGSRVFNAFTTYMGAFAAVSPLGIAEDGGPMWRGWARALPLLPRWKGLAAFVIAMIGTVSYDGMSGTEWWFELFGTTRNEEWFGTLALLGTIAVIGAAYWLASAAAARLGGSDRSVGEVGASFAHTLIPIAIAYAFAHYFTLVIFEGQVLFQAVSDPFGLGWDIFGTADWSINFWLGTTAIWYIQVAAIVIGHVAGVVLAHDRALGEFEGENAVRSQYAMLALMVALTSLGLLILAG
jgi:hypothetical protein